MESTLHVAKKVCIAEYVFEGCERTSKYQFHHDVWETACLIKDIRIPGMSGLELQAQVNSVDLKA
jgi:FixJ family two-component response regulator